MAQPDSSYAPRTKPKQRKGPVEQFASDVTHGFGELQRQMGTAVGKVKSGVQKTLKFLKK